jgi:hypothetical protein
MHTWSLVTRRVTSKVALRAGSSKHGMVRLQSVASCCRVRVCCMCLYVCVRHAGVCVYVCACMHVRIKTNITQRLVEVCQIDPVIFVTQTHVCVCVCVLA